MWVAWFNMGGGGVGRVLFYITCSICMLRLVFVCVCEYLPGYPHYPDMRLISHGLNRSQGELKVQHPTLTHSCFFLWKLYSSDFLGLTSFQLSQLVYGIVVGQTTYQQTRRDRACLGGEQGMRTKHNKVDHYFSYSLSFSFWLPLWLVSFLPFLSLPLHTFCQLDWQMLVWSPLFLLLLHKSS